MKKAVNIIYFVIGIFLLLLIFIALIRAGQGMLGSNLTFSGLLNFLSNSPAVIAPVNISNFFISSDWGIFNVFRNFFNIFSGLFGVIVWLATNIINIFAYIFYFVRFVFNI